MPTTVLSLSSSNYAATQREYWARVELDSVTNYNADAIDNFAGKLVSYTGSLESFTGSISAFTGSVSAFTGSTSAFTSSCSAFTASVMVFTGSVSAFTGAVSAFTGACSAFTASVMVYTGSVSVFTGAINNWSSSINVWTGSIDAYTGSVNTWSASINEWTASSDLYTGSVNTWTSSATSELRFLTSSLFEMFYRTGSVYVNEDVCYGGIVYNPGPARHIMEVIAFQRDSGSDGHTKIDVRKSTAMPLSADQSIFLDATVQPIFTASDGDYFVFKSSTFGPESSSWNPGEFLGVYVTEATTAGLDLTVQVQWKPSSSYV